MERDTQAAYAHPSREVVHRVGGPLSQPGESLIDVATRDIRSATTNVFELVSTLRQQNDETLGPMPQQVTSGAAKNVDSPFRGDNLRNAIGVLQSAIAELREQVIRSRQI